MSEIKNIFQRLRETKILENYSFMTALSILSALIGLVIYPYVIRVVGKEMYGTYVYAITLISYFLIIMDFGFDAPGAKAIVHARGDKTKYSFVVSAIFSAKLMLTILCGCIVAGLCRVVPFMAANKALCFCAFIQAFAQVLFPGWYFQGIKNMKVVTYINLGFRLLTIPFILLLVKTPTDIGMYAVITMSSILLGTIVAYIQLLQNGVRLSILPFKQVRQFFKDGFPFFVTNLSDGLKSAILKTVIKQTLGVGEVAIYDMAEKIVNIPHILTQNINGALFPEMIHNAAPQRVKKVLQTERIIGFAFMLLTILLSYPAVLILGGEQMREAIPVTMILSITIYTWLVVGAYLNFIFVPQNKYYFVTINQFVALFSCILLMAAGLWIWRDITVIAVARALSGIAEIIFCKYISKKHKFL